MEINNLQIFNAKNIAGITKTNEVQEDGFSQIFAQIIGIQIKELPDIEDTNMVSKILNSMDDRELSIEDMEDEIKDIIFAPMNMPEMLINHQGCQPLYLDKIPISETISNIQDEPFILGIEANMDKGLPLLMDTKSIEEISQSSNPDSAKLAISFKDNYLLKEDFNKDTLIDIASKGKESIQSKGEDRPYIVDSKQISGAYKTPDMIVKAGKDIYEITNDYPLNQIVKNVARDGFNIGINRPRELDFNDNIQKVIDSFKEMIDLNLGDEGKSMKVRLYPEELGYIDVSLKMEEGKLIAKIMVESDQVRELFNTHSSQLSDRLIKQDINIERLDININLNTESHSNPREQEKHEKNHFKNFKEINSLENIPSIVTNEGYVLNIGGLSILA